MPRSETPFFEDPFYKAEELDRSLEVFESAPEDARLGLRRPDYLCSVECPERIARHFPGVKLIAVLRHPVDRAVSQYFHAIRSGRSGLTAIDADIERLLTVDPATSYLRRWIIDYGLYGAAVARYRQFFPADRLLLITDIDLWKDPRGAVQRICRYLQVEEDFMPSFAWVPRNQGVYDLNLLHLIAWLGRYRYDFDPLTGSSSAIPGTKARWAGVAVRTLIRGSSAWRLLVKNTPASLSQENRERLARFYLPDVERLEQLMGYDLSAWKSPTSPER